MTGPASFSPVLNKERPGLNLPRDIAGLRNECKKRKIDFSGNKQEVLYMSYQTRPNAIANSP